MVQVCLMLGWLQGQRRSSSVNAAGGAEQGNLGVIQAQAQCSRGAELQRGKCRRWARSAGAEACRSRSVQAQQAGDLGQGCRGLGARLVQLG
ncbi:hypothetical protein SLEP1_g48744 [Rubroshorea leprosula]|uniref:Uncharacterized protein n=1 Tax=Rubroshorea leprosula TaxID=152421 RepID=A0AAV5LUS5_9ROSI|nr:hypothetical protein SLEP1_g48744 [Rubroshorea leprosula]